MIFVVLVPFGFLQNIKLMENWTVFWVSATMKKRMLQIWKRVYNNNNSLSKFILLTDIRIKIQTRDNYYVFSHGKAGL